MRKNILFILFLCTHWLAMGQTSYRYWFDGDTIAIYGEETAETAESIIIDASKLTDDIHALRFQIKDDANVWSSTRSNYFVKQPANEIAQCSYWFNGAYDNKQPLSTSNGASTIDVSSLTDGLHAIRLQLESKHHSSTATRFFYKNTKTADNLKCFYSLDNSAKFVEAGQIANGAFDFELNLDTITDGLHSLTCVLVDENNFSSNLRTSFFVKLPTENGITKYSYWLNDSTSNAHQVNLNVPANPLTLFGIVPVYSCPIRSNRFHFEVREGKPMVYALNDLSVCFYDATNHMVTASKSYIDYTIGGEIDNMKSLVEVDGVEKLNRPAENEIKWYCIDAVSGDSIAVKADKACTIQIFSPNGVEVYNANGTASTTYGGITATNKGKYYIALHDVTSSNVSTVTLSYLHFYEVKYEIPEEKYSTLILPFDHELPAGMKIYTCEAISDNCVKLKEQTSITANTPYIVYGTPGEHSFRGINKADKTAYSTAYMTGVYELTFAPIGSYILSPDKDSNEVRFEKVGESEHIRVEPYHCYLNIGDYGETLNLSESDDSSVELATPDQTPTIVDVYNVAGQLIRSGVAFERALDGLSPGIYLINDKKYVVTR